MRKKLGVAVFALLVGVPTGFADTISVLNTGMAADGSVATAGKIDSHYQLYFSADGSSFQQLSATVMNPNGAWVTPSGAQWIGPGADGNQGWSSGYYVYQTTFDLTGYDSSTAVLNGAEAADDNLYVFLNNYNSPVYSSTAGFSSLNNFSLTSGFVNGINTIDFVVYNSSGPTGLLLENTSVTAAPLTSPTPEPASLLLIGTGSLLGICVIKNR